MQHDVLPNVSALGLVARERCVDIVAVAQGLLKPSASHPALATRNPMCGRAVVAASLTSTTGQISGARGEIVDRRAEGLLDAQDVDGAMAAARRSPSSSTHISSSSCASQTRYQMKL